LGVTHSLLRIALTDTDDPVIRLMPQFQEIN
jgi:hypothetical protein